MTQRARMGWGVATAAALFGAFPHPIAGHIVDLGWLLATWPSSASGSAGAIGVQPWTGFPEADELVARYRERSDRSLDAIEWYAVLACYKLGIILEGTHARAFAGQADKAVGDALHATTVGLFAQALERIAKRG